MLPLSRQAINKFRKRANLTHWCELGSHSATGEEFADDPNALTAAEAQAFKRAAVCFGLGRYLYYFTGTWVDLDDHKRPKRVPHLAGWATPAGWLQGLRPGGAREHGQSKGTTAGNGRDGQQSDSSGGKNADVLSTIERMERVVGKRMYRGILKSIARVWDPKDIHDPKMQEKVLAQMQEAEHGFRQVVAAGDKARRAAFGAILSSLRLSSLDQVDNLKTLEEIVVALDTAAARAE